MEVPALADLEVIAAAGGRDRRADPELGQRSPATIRIDDGSAVLIEIDCADVQRLMNVADEMNEQPERVAPHLRMAGPWFGTFSRSTLMACALTATMSFSAVPAVACAIGTLLDRHNRCSERVMRAVLRRECLLFVR